MKVAVLLLLLPFSLATDLYSHSAVDIEGNGVSLEKYRGQVSLVVNVASACGYTHHNYRELVKLQEKYGHRGFTVLAFPCNQFGKQEPGTDAEILRFAIEHYEVDFPVFSKVDVYGENACEVYHYLMGVTKSVPSWNFCKYLVDRDGRVVQYFSVTDSFDGIKHSVERLLGKHTEL